MREMEYRLGNLSESRLTSSGKMPRVISLVQPICPSSPPQTKQHIDGLQNKKDSSEKFMPTEVSKMIAETTTGLGKFSTHAEGKNLAKLHFFK